MARLSSDGFRPGLYDVLCDRSKHAFRHIGNRRFRIIVECHLYSYARAKSKGRKSEIVQTIVGTIVSAGGRFVCRGKDSAWKILTYTKAREKVGHALRAGLAALEEKGGPRSIYDIIGEDPAVSELQYYRSLSTSKVSESETEHCDQEYETALAIPSLSNITSSTEQRITSDQQNSPNRIPITSPPKTTISKQRPLLSHEQAYRQKIDVIDTKNTMSLSLLDICRHAVHMYSSKKQKTEPPVISSPEEASIF